MKRVFPPAVVAVALLALAWLLPATGDAAFPGKPGAIVYSYVETASGLVESGGLYEHGSKRSEKAKPLTKDPTDESPAISKNGKLIAVERDPEPENPDVTHIYVMRRNGAGVRELTEGAFVDSNPTFSPDGKTIVFDRGKIGQRQRQLFSVPVSGGEPTQLTSGSGEDTEAVFTPNGRQIVFASNRRKSGHGDIYAMLPNGKGAHPLFDSNLREASPDVSPDGKQIVYVTKGNLYLGSVAGGKSKALTHFSSEFADPTFAPDGKHIAFLQLDGFESDLDVIRTDGRGEVKFFVEAGTEEEGYGRVVGAPAWGPLSK